MNAKAAKLASTLGPEFTYVHDETAALIRADFITINSSMSRVKYEMIEKIIKDHKHRSAGYTMHIKMDMSGYEFWSDMMALEAHNSIHIFAEITDVDAINDGLFVSELKDTYRCFQALVK